METNESSKVDKVLSSHMQDTQETSASQSENPMSAVSAPIMPINIQLFSNNETKASNKSNGK